MNYCSKRWTVFLLFIGLVLIFYFSGVGSYITLENIQRYALSLKNFVDRYYFFSAFIYCVTFVVATVFFIPVTLLLTVLGGYLFGIVFGLLYALLSATLGSVVLFLLIRYVFAGIVQRRFAHYIAVFKKQLKKRGYSYLLMLQLLPVTPTAVINTVAGLLPISAFTFAWTTCVGLLPGSLVYVIAGRELAQIRNVNDIISWTMIIILFLLALGVLFIPYLLSYRSSLKQ